MAFLSSSLLVLSLSLLLPGVLPSFLGAATRRLLLEGEDALAQGDIETARRSFGLASDESPELHHPHISLAYAECEFDNVDECVRAFGRGLKLMPKETRADKAAKIAVRHASYLALSESLSRQDRWKGARDAAQSCLKLDNSTAIAVRAAWRLAQALESLAFEAQGGWGTPLAKQAVDAWARTLTLPAFPTTHGQIRAICHLGYGLMLQRVEQLEAAASQLRLGLAVHDEWHADDAPTDAQTDTQQMDWDSDAIHGASNLVDIYEWMGDHSSAREIIEEGMERGVWERAHQTPGSYTRGVGNAMPWPHFNEYRGVTGQVRAFESRFDGILSEMETLLTIDGKRGLSFGCMEALATVTPPLEADEGGKQVEERGRWHSRTVVCDGEARDQTPETCAALEEARTYGKVMSVQFLRLQPGSNIRAHSGAGNHRWVVHLGLVVPDGVAITVGGETRTWQEGKCLVFDDSFKHSVSHGGVSDRVVLGVQIGNPEFEYLQQQQQQQQQEQGKDEL